MHCGEPTPFTPAPQPPPPVPAVSPDPSPAPVPLPMPPLVPMPIPPPPPGPPDMVTAPAIGSPGFVSGGFAIFSSGGPSSVGSIGIFGARFLIVASGGVNCVYENFGARPLVGGVIDRSPPPPPPPAFFVPAGNFAMYGEISNGVESNLLFACADLGKICVKRGTTSNAIIPTCSPIEITCVHPKFSSFDQISLPLPGLLAHCAGGCFTGKNNSLRRSPNPPNPAPQATSRRLLETPFGAGPDLRTVFRFSLNPSP